MATAQVGVDKIRGKAGYSDAKPFKDGFVGGGEPRSVLEHLQFAYEAVVSVYKTYQETVNLVPAIGASRVELGVPTAISIMAARIPGFRYLHEMTEDELAAKFGVDWRAMAGRLRAYNLDLRMNGVPSLIIFPRPLVLEGVEVEVAKSAPTLTVAGSVLVGVPDNLLDAVYTLGAISLVVADTGSDRRAIQHRQLSLQLSYLYPALSKSIPEMPQDA